MATKIIGKVLPDGRVKYIKCEDRETIFETARILLRFYKIESRVDALVELGNIYELGPSPYGRFIEDQNDRVHCAAMIRDFKHIGDEEKPQIIDGKDVFLGATCPAMLFENGQWLFVHDRQFIPVNTKDDLPHPKREMDTFRLSIIRLSRHKGRMQKSEIGFEFSQWRDMVQQAKTDDDTYYVFSSNRLIATINPKPIPNTL